MLTCCQNSPLYPKKVPILLPQHYLPISWLMGLVVLVPVDLVPHDAFAWKISEGVKLKRQQLKRHSMQDYTSESKIPRCMFLSFPWIPLLFLEHRFSLLFLLFLSSTWRRCKQLKTKRSINMHPGQQIFRNVPQKTNSNIWRARNIPGLTGSAMLLLVG